MRYLMLIYADEAAMAGKPREQMAGAMEAWFNYTEDLQRSGKMLGGEALQPTSAATTVRLKEGRTLISDGPFAETKEQLGGYYMIEASDLDEALDWAARMPHLPTGGAVEVRPIREFDGARP